MPARDGSDDEPPHEKHETQHEPEQDVQKPGRDAMSQRLATRIEQDVESPLPWRSIAKKTVMAVVAGVTIYLVFPSLTEVFDSFPKLTQLDAVWFAFAVVLQAAHFACTIALQRIALRTKAWFSVATSQLAGKPIDSGLEHAALLGIAAFVLFAGFGAIVLGMDRPIRWAGRLVQAVRNRIKRKAEPMTGLEDRLVYERNRIRDVLGRQWKAAMLLSSGRLAFDFGTLLATIRATGAKPNPSLVLLAYAVAGLLALIPLTPGGLGIVEAGLSALLILAGVPGGDAVVATGREPHAAR